jgi:hypothetical protein
MVVERVSDRIQHEILLCYSYTKNAIPPIPESPIISKAAVYFVCARVGG